MLREESTGTLLEPIIAVACLTTGLVIAGIVACARMDAIWRSVMEAAKVEYWLPLAQTESMATLVLLLPALSFWMCGLLVIANRHRVPRKRELVVVMMLGVAVVGISAVGFISLARNGCPQDASIAALFADKSAVASYNQHTCVARCLGTTGSTIASSGENDEAIAVAHNCARTWCATAIRADNFTNGHWGSPFDELRSAFDCEPLGAWHSWLFTDFLLLVLFNCVVFLFGIVVMLEKRCKLRAVATEKPTLSAKLVESNVNTV